MVEKLAHGVNSFSAGRTARYNDALSALRDGRRLIYEVRKIVSVNFFLDCSKQDGFLHGRTPDDVHRKGRKDSIRAWPRRSEFSCPLSEVSRDLRPMLAAIQQKGCLRRSCIHRTARSTSCSNQEPSSVAPQARTLKIPLRPPRVYLCGQHESDSTYPSQTILEPKHVPWCSIRYEA